MGKFTVRGIREDLVDFLKPKLKTLEKGTEEYVFVDSMIKNLERSFLDDRTLHKIGIIRYDPGLTLKLVDAGLDENDAKVFACLLLNDDSLLVSEIAKALDFDRGKTYRILNNLLEKGLILEIQNSTLHYVATNRKDPLKPLKLFHEQQIQKYSTFSITG